MRKTLRLLLMMGSIVIHTSCNTEENGSSFACNSGNCAEDGNGNYNSLSDCEIACEGGAALFSPGLGLTDVDGNTYSSIILGNGQEWMGENLRVTHFANGDLIPFLTVDSLWRGTQGGACCFYENNADYGAVYGVLYNFYSVANVSPAGWHVPSDEEWVALSDYLGGMSVAGGKLKATGVEFWQSPNIEATNESGFNALAGGNREYQGGFNLFRTNAEWWTATSYGQEFEDIAWCRLIGYSDASLSRQPTPFTSGLSIRCIKN